MYVCACIIMEKGPLSLSLSANDSRRENAEGEKSNNQFYAAYATPEMKMSLCLCWNSRKKVYSIGGSVVNKSFAGELHIRVTECIYRRYHSISRRTNAAYYSIDPE